MVASLALAAVVGLPAAESAAWVAHLRARLADVKSVAADFTRTTTDLRTGFSSRCHCRLWLARLPAGGWVGNLRMERVNGKLTGYTLWNGRVYETDHDARLVTEYVPGDGDPLRMAADFFEPSLGLLADLPGRPALRPRLTGRDAHYQLHTLNTSVGGFPVLWFGFGDQPPTPVRTTVATMAVGGRAIPRHLPRLIQSEWSGEGQLRTIDVQAVWLDAVDGPKPADIADPTVVRAGYQLVRPLGVSPKR